MSDDFFHPNFDPGEFRRTAAKYVKLLIRARWRSEPGFLTSTVRDDSSRQLTARLS
jgi:hypothetical protein